MLKVTLTSLINGVLCVSRKYPDPLLGGNWKFWGGRGFKGLGNFSGVRGLKTEIHFQRAHTMIISHQLLLVVLVLLLLMLHFSYQLLHLKMTFHFFIKVASKQTSLNKR